jgi:multiple sugar transport system substrate-binding protein
MVIVREELTRRDFLKAAAAASAALSLAGCGGDDDDQGAQRATTPTGARELGGELKILQWSHFVPAYDEWFDNTYVKEWGEANGVQVTVDHVAVADIGPRAAAEVAAQSGHDLFGFLSPPAAYEDQVIDHTDIIEELESKVGKYSDLGHKSTFNPKTEKYFGVSDNYVPDPVVYRKDLWDEIGIEPNTWDDVLKAAPLLREKGNPIGIGMSNELDSNMDLIALSMCFGSFIQDEDANVTLDSPETVEAVEFGAELFKQGMTNEIFAWDPAANNRFIESGKGSMILNAISATRTPEEQNPELAKNLSLAPIPEGPGGRLGLEHVMGVYVIWKFANNQDAARQFVIDLVTNYEDAFTNSKFYNFPSFPESVSGIEEKLANDEVADPPDKYVILGEIAQTATHNVGHPGFSNAAIDETFNTFLIPQMFAQAARGQMSAQESVQAIAGQVEQIFEKWRGQGKI